MHFIDNKYDNYFKNLLTPGNSFFCFMKRKIIGFYNEASWVLTASWFEVKDEETM